MTAALARHAAIHLTTGEFGMLFTFLLGFVTAFVIEHRK